MERQESPKLETPPLQRQTSPLGQERAKQKAPLLLKQLWRLALPFMQSQRSSYLLLLIILILTIGESRMMVKFSYAKKNFETAITSKDTAGFWSGIREVLFLICVMCPLFSVTNYAEARLKMQWQVHLSRELAKRYFSHRIFYTLTLQQPPHTHEESNRSISKTSDAVWLDHPDQRLTDDVETLVESTVTLLGTILSKVANVISFSVVLIKISPQLFVFAIAYSALASFLTDAFFTQRLQELVARGISQDADRRFRFVRVRQHAEEIAFLHGEQSEAAEIDSVFAKRINTKSAQILLESVLACFRQLFYYVTMVIPYIVVAERFFSGEIEYGMVTQTAMAFNMLKTGLGVLVMQSNLIGKLRASAVRIHELEQIMLVSENYHRTGSETEQMNYQTDQMLGFISTKCHDNAEVTQADDDVKLAYPLLRTENLSVLTPSRSCTLLQEVNVCLRRHESILIVGPSGVGKTSLLRVFAGLWRSGTGCVTRPTDMKCRFLPQRPYLPLGGTLSEQLQYPTSNPIATVDDDDDDPLVAALQNCALDSLLKRLQPAGGLNAEAERWESMLSLGEQQRLAFARLILARSVQLVFLDEATSALDEASEKTCYEMLSKYASTYISVGHRSSLLKYHTHVLVFEPSANPSYASNVRFVTAAEYKSSKKQWLSDDGVSV